MPLILNNVNGMWIIFVGNFKDLFHENTGRFSCPYFRKKKVLLNLELIIILNNVIGKSDLLFNDFLLVIAFK